MQKPSESFSDTPVTWTFLERFDQRVESDPTSLAIACPHQPGDLYGFNSIPLKSEERPYLRWSYHTLKQVSYGLVAGLLHRGASSGTPLVSVCRNQAEYALSILAAYRLGLLYIPLSPDHFAQPADLRVMLNRAVKHCNTSEIFFISDDSDILKQAFSLLDGNEEINVKCELFGDLITSEQATSDHSLKSQTENLLLFTSGTSSTPKGCYLDSSIVLNTLEPNTGLKTIIPEDRVIVTTPGHHLYGYTCIAFTLLHGAGLIFASAKYRPDAVLQAALDEKVTILTFVPSMIHSILGMLEEQNNMPKIKGIVVAGSAIAPSLLGNLQKRLGGPWVENMYGMTEGVLVSTGNIDVIESIVTDGYLAGGKAADNAMIRICDPDTGETVPQGTSGQLVYSGPGLIDAYIFQPDSDVFFERDGRQWINTGDEAFIGTNGMAYIIGRFKDIIVRGGENISMSKLDILLAEIPKLSTLQAQVIGAEDAVAGEVPVLITKETISQETVQQLKDTIRDVLGSIYVPRNVLSLDNLGLNTFPLTTSGKISKRQLTRMVNDLTQLQDQAELNVNLLGSEMARAVTIVWARLLGTEASQVNIETPLAQISDSMLLVSARDRIRKLTGHSVDLPSWIAAETIHDQIKLLVASTHENQTQKSFVPVQATRTGPPQASDIVHLTGQESGFHCVKREVEQLIEKDGLGWEDVLDIFPCSDWVQLQSESKVADSWNIRGIVISNNASMADMRKALDAALLNHPMMLSYIISNTGIGEQTGLHVLMRPTKKVTDLCIMDYGTVGTVAEVKQLADDYPPQYHPQLPGPLFHAYMIFVEETSSAAVIYNVSHAMTDATSLALFGEDLDQALSCKLTPHVPYKIWANNYHTMRTSVKAEAAIRYHANELADLREHYNVLWPLPSPEIVVVPERKNLNGHMISFSAPSIRTILQKSTVTQPIILQSALALVLLAHTNHSHALMASLQAGRSSFPFLSDHSSLASLEAADVAGPTWGCALVLTTIRPGETVLQYLERMQAVQDGFSKHHSVPWSAVFKRLGLSSSQILPAISNSVLFNWLPGLPAMILGGNPYKNTTQDGRLRFRTGVGAGAGTGGPDGTEVVIWLQGAIANTSTVQVESFAEQWKQSTLWLLNEENWYRPAIEGVEFMKNVSAILAPVA